MSKMAALEARIAELEAKLGEEAGEPDSNDGLPKGYFRDGSLVRNSMGEIVSMIDEPVESYEDKHFREGTRNRFEAEFQRKWDSAGLPSGQYWSFEGFIRKLSGELVDPSEPKEVLKERRKDERERLEVIKEDLWDEFYAENLARRAAETLDINNLPKINWRASQQVYVERNTQSMPDYDPLDR